MANSKVSNSVLSVNKVTGAQGIANLWKAHFQSLYNVLNDNAAKQTF